MPALQVQEEGAVLPGATWVHYDPAETLRLLKNKGLLCPGKYKMTKDFSQLAPFQHRVRKSQPCRAPTACNSHTNEFMGFCSSKPAMSLCPRQSHSVA